MLWCKNNLYNLTRGNPPYAYNFSVEINISKWKNKKKCWWYRRLLFFCKPEEANKALRKCIS